MVYMANIVSAFQLGSSTVVTLPKELGIKPGEKLKVEKSGKRVILKQQKMTGAEIDKLVESLSGGLKFKKDLSPGELNRILDEEYEDRSLLSGR